MSDNLRFLAQVCGISSLLLAASILVLHLSGRDDLIMAVVYGFFVSLINIASAFFSIKWAFDKPLRTFFAVVLGGMGIRMLVLATALFFVWKFTQIPLIGFIVSLVIFYLLLQFIEIRFVQKSLADRKAAI